MTDETEWISLGEAAKLLGVHPTTVRNWADQGDLPFRRTPGGHRRFQRSILEAWSPRQAKPEKAAPPPSHNMQMIVEYALGHTRFGLGGNDLSQRGWYEQLSAGGVDQLRAFGRRILEALLLHLEDKTPEGEEFAQAQALGAEYAEMLKGEGLTLAQAVQGFVYFDDYLVESVIQVMGPNVGATSSDWSDLLRQINAFTNEILVTMTKHYQS